MTYTTTPELLRTLIAVATPEPEATTSSVESVPTPAPTLTGAGSGLFPGAIFALSIAIGVAALLA